MLLKYFFAVEYKTYYLPFFLHLFNLHSTISFFVIMFYPVSYTHLDVYKRQEIGRTIGPMGHNQRANRPRKERKHKKESSGPVKSSREALNVK